MHIFTLQLVILYTTTKRQLSEAKFKGLGMCHGVCYVQICPIMICRGCGGWLRSGALSFQLTTGPGFQQVSITEKASLRPHRRTKAKTRKTLVFSNVRLSTSTFWNMYKLKCISVHPRLYLFAMLFDMYRSPIWTPKNPEASGSKPRSQSSQSFLILLGFLHRCMR